MQHSGRELLHHLFQLVDLAAGGGDLVADLAAHLVAESLQIRGDPDVLAAGGCWRWRLRRFCRRRRCLLLGRHLCAVDGDLWLVTCERVATGGGADGETQEKEKALRLDSHSHFDNWQRLLVEKQAYL